MHHTKLLNLFGRLEVMNMVSPATAMYTARAVGTASISLLAGEYDHQLRIVHSTRNAGLVMNPGAMLSNNAFIMPALFQTPTLSPKDRMVSRYAWMRPFLAYH